MKGRYYVKVYLLWADLIVSLVHDHASVRQKHNGWPQNGKLYQHVQIWLLKPHSIVAGVVKIIPYMVTEFFKF